MNKDYRFDYEWAFQHLDNYKTILSKINNPKVLEIGSFQGYSTVFFIENQVQEIHCVDKWNDEKWDNHKINGEKYFDYNVDVAKRKSPDTVVVKHKQYSHDFLCENVRKYEKYFDIIIIDGSHKPTDVIVDATLAYKMLSSGGFMVFDDYEYIDDLNRSPKLAIDSFCTIYYKKMKRCRNMNYLGQVILRNRI